MPDLCRARKRLAFFLSALSVVKASFRSCNLCCSTKFLNVCEKLKSSFVCLCWCSKKNSPQKGRSLLPFGAQTYSLADYPAQPEAHLRASSASLRSLLSFFICFSNFCHSPDEHCITCIWEPQLTMNDVKTCVTMSRQLQPCVMHAV